MSPFLPFSYDDDDVPLLDSSSSLSSSVSASTVAATPVATGHHMLKIQGYSRLKATHGGENEMPSYIESSAFKVGGHTWKIRCYLNDRTISTVADAQGFVSLYLDLCSSHSAAGVIAEFEFALLGHQQPAGAAGVVRRRSDTAVVYGPAGGDNCCGFPRFVSMEELERSGKFLEDDSFAVRCTVTVVEERTVREKAVTAEDMARMGMLCKCDDELCKRYHVDRPQDESLLERFAKFCCSFCRGPV